MSSKKEIVIVDIPSPGVLGGVFSDLILALTHSINKLGLTVNYQRRLIRTSNPVIIFGLYREFINKTNQIQLPNNYFIFNLAPILSTSIPWFDNYIKYVSNHNFIDYSYHNISHLSNFSSNPKASHLFDFGYFDLMPFRGFQRTSAYIFYGKLNEDRIQRLKEIKNSGININILNNVWGHERDIQIRTAKAVINIGKYNPSLLEVYRIWHSLCIGTPVYSDAGIDQSLVKKYEKYATIADRLDSHTLETPAISADLYQRDTSFIESTRALLDFIKQ